ncbi:MAG: hypothetical protein J6U36_01570, partial [Oscillospiraceae bacterium]|nr:hypothetical protein [Oscillospiraceae bacterium]
ADNRMPASMAQKHIIRVKSPSDGMFIYIRMISHSAVEYVIAGENGAGSGGMSEINKLEFC